MDTVSLEATAPPRNRQVVDEVSAFTGRLVAGDEDAWREFHGRYFDRLLRYLLVVTRGDEQAAREAVQLTFVRAVRHMRTFAAEPALWSWLTVLARSAVVDEHRKRRRYLGFLDRWFASTPTEPAAGPPGGESRLAEMIEASLDALPAAERQLLESKYLEGLSVRALADATGDTEKAVESRLGRVRQKLRTTLLRQLKDEASR